MDGNGLAVGLTDDPTQWCRDGKLVRAVAERHESPTKGVTIDGPRHLHQPASPEQLHGARQLHTGPRVAWLHFAEGCFEGDIERTGRAGQCRLLPDSVALDRTATRARAKNTTPRFSVARAPSSTARTCPAAGTRRAVQLPRPGLRRAWCARTPPTQFVGLVDHRWAGTGVTTHLTERARWQPRPRSLSGRTSTLPVVARKTRHHPGLRHASPAGPRTGERPGRTRCRTRRRQPRPSATV